MNGWQKRIAKKLTARDYRAWAIANATTRKLLHTGNAPTYDRECTRHTIAKPLGAALVRWGIEIQRLYSTNSYHFLYHSEDREIIDWLYELLHRKMLVKNATALKSHYKAKQRGSSR